LVESRRPRINTLSSLRHRNFRLLWLSTLFGSSGLWIQQTSVGWLTYLVTGSPFLLGLVNGIRAIPLLLLGPLGGVAADRFDRKKMLLSTHLFLLVTTASFATIVALDLVNIWNIIAFTLLTGVAWSFNMPTRQSTIATVVPKQDLMNAYALNASGVNITRILGPSIAGVLIAVVTIAGNFYLQAATYVGVTAMVWRMKVPIGSPSSSKASVWQNLKEGLKYVWTRPAIRSQMSIALIPVLVAMPYVALLPIFAVDILEVGGLGFGLMMAAPGIGALAGTLTIATLGNVKRKGLTMLAALMTMGGALLLFSFSRWYIPSLLLLGVVGACQMVYMTTNMTMLQMDTPNEFRGRVMGVWTLNQGLQPLGSLIAGSLAEIWDAPMAVAIMGCSVIAFSSLAFFKLPSVRRA
jgi:MFS family permease